MSATATAEPVLTIGEVAERLRCRNTDTIYRMVARGDLRAVRVGRLLRVPESALREFLAGATASDGETP